MSETRQVCTFLAFGLLFGVDVMNVQEVLRYQEMTAVPLTSRTVGGLINLRGQIVTAIDVRARLGLPAAEGSAPPMNVVVRIGDRVVSLLVDEIGDVLEVEQRLFERAPETMSPVWRDVVSGVFKLDERLLLLLDAERIVAFDVAGGSSKTEPA